MNIYIVAEEKNCINKFVPELAIALREQGHYVVCNKEVLWTDEVYKFNIVYFQWPEYVYTFKPQYEHVLFLEERIKEIKRRNIQIISQCHNLTPHDKNKDIEKLLYKVVYGNCDIMIHMGRYSKQLLESKYTNAKHVIIPHHIYENTYNFDLDENECKRELGIPLNKQVILCFGAFRNDDERQMIFRLKRELRDYNIVFLTPGYYKGKIIQKNIFKGFLSLIKIIKYRMKGMYFINRSLSDRELELYYCASDIVLIQRPIILNSGNLPMAFAAGKIVVGPNVGNVGSILKETRNLTYNPSDFKSLKQVTLQSLVLIQTNLGKENKSFAISNWSPTKIAKILITHIKYNYENYRKN